MKRFLSFLIAVMMICTMVAMTASAQEPAQEVPEDSQIPEAGIEADDPASNTTSFPGESLLGHTWQEVMNMEKSEFSMDVEANSSVENKTLSDGSSYMEAVIKNATDGRVTIDRYFYFVGDKLFALTNIYNVPEGYTIEQGLEGLKMYGAYIPLDLSSLNTLQKEIVSDQVTLQDGMMSWKSKYGFIAVAGRCEDSEHVFIMLLVNPNAARNSERTPIPGVTGMEDLTPEETEKVNSYIDFLQTQTAKQVNEYIEFLKKQR